MKEETIFREFKNGRLRAEVIIKTISHKKLLRRIRGMDQYYKVTGWEKTTSPKPLKKGMFSEYQVHLNYEK